MGQEECPHRWGMVNVEQGHVVTEQCAHCKKVATYFSEEPKTVMEEYRQDDHFWNVMKSNPSFRFDLECPDCGTRESFEHLMGLTRCYECDDTCPAAVLQRKTALVHGGVYVAFGFLPFEEKNGPNKREVALLEEYFNRQRQESDRPVRIVGNRTVKKDATCYAEVIKEIEDLPFAPHRDI